MLFLPCDVPAFTINDNFINESKPTVVPSDKDQRGKGWCKELVGKHETYINEISFVLCTVINPGPPLHPCGEVRRDIRTLAGEEEIQQSLSLRKEKERQEVYRGWTQ